MLCKQSEFFVFSDQKHMRACFISKPFSTQSSSESSDMVRGTLTPTIDLLNFVESH